MVHEFKRLAQRKREKLLFKTRKLFREGSLSQELAYLLVTKGKKGYVTDDEIKKKICKDLINIPNQYERQIKIGIRIRALIRDIRFKSGVWIGKVWIPSISDFGYKVIEDGKDFDYLIEKIQDKINSLDSLQKDLKECKSSEDYRKRIEEFYSNFG